MQQPNQSQSQTVSFEQIEQQLDLLFGQCKRLVINQIAGPLFNGTADLQQRLLKAQERIKELEAQFPANLSTENKENGKGKAKASIKNK